EPARAELPEDPVPVEVARLQLRGRGVAAIGNPHGAADAEAALGEVQPVADGAADAVVFAPPYEIGGDAALHDAVLEQATDLVVHERRAHRCSQPEALPEAARGVVLAPALPDGEGAGGAYPALAGVESEHHLAQRDLVKGAACGRFDAQWHRLSFSGLVRMPAQRPRRTGGRARGPPPQRP